MLIFTFHSLVCINVLIAIVLFVIMFELLIVGHRVQLWSL